MKGKLLLLLLFTSVSLIQAQDVVVMDPADANSSNEVTITFDATLGNGGLVGAEKVYAHMGVVTDAPGSTEWTFVVGNWGQDDGIGEMTKVDGEDDKWEITLSPSIMEYFSVPGGTNVFRLSMVFRNADGSQKGEGTPGDYDWGEVTSNGDLFVDLVVGNFIVFNSPEPSQYLMLNDQITIDATASGVSDLEILIDDGAGFISVATAPASENITHNYTITTPGESIIAVKVVADFSGEITEVIRNVRIFTVEDSPTATMPGGLVKGINYDADDTKVTLVLFAPNKDWVYATGDFNSWAVDPAYLMSKDGDHFWIELTGLTPGQPYVFGYLANSNDGTTNAVLVGDPYADLVIDPTGDADIPSDTYPDIPPSDLDNLPPNQVDGGSILLTAFETGQTPYSWGPIEDTWERPEEEDLVIYELLVRDFVGNYKHLLDTLDYIERLGVNAIELMPINEFGGNTNWGYQPDYYMAPDKSYGTKDDLKALVEACHERGIAVILDVVYNHADLHPYVWLYYDFQANTPAANSPFFNETPIPSCVSFFRDWNHESAYTVEMIDRTLRYWLEEFHIDGYRFDVSHGFTQQNNCGGFVQERVDNVTHYMQTIWDVDPDAYATLEHFAFDEIDALQAAGAYTWAFEAKFRYQDAMKAKPANANISEAADPGTIASMENHDEQRLVFEALIDGAMENGYNIQSVPVALERAKMAPAFFFPLPGPKLMWMFGELGYDIDINEGGRTGEKPPPWGNDPDALGYYEDPERQKVFGVYAAILDITQEYREVFRDGTHDLTRLNNEVRRIAITHPTMDVVILGNWSTSEQTVNPDFTQTGEWFDFFSGESIQVDNVLDPLKLFPGQFNIYTTIELPTPPGDLVSTPEPPELEPIADQTTQENTPTGPITVTIIEGNVPVDEVTLSGNSSSPVVANSDIVFSGTGTTRTMVITPRENLFGTTEITVTASDGIFSGSTTFTLEVIEDVTGLEDNELSRQIRVYPNPTKRTLYLVKSERIKRSVTVRLVDVSGRVYESREAFSGGKSQDLMDLNGYAPGLYLVEIIDSNGQKAVKRIVKN